MDIGPGTHVTPHIRLVRPLGHGGMGSVWQADHLALRAPVAVKLMSPRIAGDARAVARFATEAAAAARIRSPHVVEILDHGVVDGVPFIVMEQLRGEDLQARLQRDGQLTAATLVPIVRGTCRALAKAHAMGVVHRDVKPANLFLVEGDDGPLVKVLDFGLAKLEGDAPHARTASGSVFGTLAYLSPEQARSARESSPQSDLWSLGVVVYQCLTGALPFAEESLMGMCIAIDEARFTPPSRVAPGVPRSLDAWLARALEREPRDRFASATEMAEAFVRIVEGGASLPPRVSSSSWRLASRARKLAPFAVAGMVAAAGLLAVGAGPGLSRGPAVAMAGTVDPLPSSATLVAFAAAPPAPARASSSPAASAAPAVHARVRAVAPAATPEEPEVEPPTPSVAPGTGLRLNALATRDLYPPSYVRAAVGRRNAALRACFLPEGAVSPLSTYEAYTVGISPAGAVTRVGHPGEGGSAAVDACMERELRALGLRPTDGGKQGTMTLYFVVR